MSSLNSIFLSGIIPWFLRNATQPPVAPDVFVLDYFLQAEQDGLKVTWQHGVNSRETLEHAMKSTRQRDKDTKNMTTDCHNKYLQ